MFRCSGIFHFVHVHVFDNTLKTNQNFNQIPITTFDLLQDVDLYFRNIKIEKQRKKSKKDDAFIVVKIEMKSECECECE